MHCCSQKLGILDCLVDDGREERAVLSQRYRYGEGVLQSWCHSVQTSQQVQIRNIEHKQIEVCDILGASTQNLAHPTRLFYC